MNIYIYDSTFDGLLTLVREAAERLMPPDRIVCSGNFQTGLFHQYFHITTDADIAGKLWDDLEIKTSLSACRMIYRAFLSETTGIEMKICHFISRAMHGEENLTENIRDDLVYNLKEAERRVSREAQRMIQFVRFEDTGDSMYYAPVEPKYNVLPLIGKHFEKRFASQRWVVFDTKRRYGLYYDLQDTSIVTITNQSMAVKDEKSKQQRVCEPEELYSLLWKNYYHSICIPERKNLRLQMQFMPKRFWKYLPEKVTEL